MGSKNGLLGQGVQANAMWLMERKAKQEHVVIIECTSLFDEEKAAVAALTELYSFDCIIHGPDDFGYPCTRQRKFTVGVLRSWGYLNCGLSAVGSFFRMQQTRGDTTWPRPLKT